MLRRDSAKASVYSSAGTKSVEIFAIAGIGHVDAPPAIAVDMVVEGRVTAERGNDGGAGFHDQPHGHAQQPVDAFADHDVFAAAAEMGCQGLAQLAEWAESVLLCL